MHPSLPSKKSFNSRPHKEVDETAVVMENPEGDFQFTTSQGGRRFIGVLIS